MGRVAVVFTGGTISMRPDATAGGNLPALDGAGILALAPEAVAVAELEPIDWGMVSASHLTFDQLLDIARLVAAQLAQLDIAGVVVVQGTDAIEETTFAFDLLLPGDKPVVVTGAMRDASAPDYDGPRNLVDAVRCAASDELAGMGALTVLDGLVIAGDQVVKTHSTALDTFQARDAGPVARVVDGTVRVVSPRGARRHLPLLPAHAVEDVYLVTEAMGSDGSLIRGLAPLSPRGLVVEAAGAGNTPPDMLTAAQELMRGGTTVVLTTRCPQGVVQPAYAFPGGGATWQRAGAILSALDGPKSRVALALGLAAGLDRARLEALIGQ